MKTTALGTRQILLVSMAIAVISVGPFALADSESTPGDWLSSVRQQIAEEEYQVTWQDSTYLQDVDAAWHAPNRAHGFRVLLHTRRAARDPARGDRAVVGVGTGARGLRSR